MLLLLLLILHVREVTSTTLNSNLLLHLKIGLVSYPVGKYINMSCIFLNLQFIHNQPRLRTMSVNRSDKRKLFHKRQEADDITSDYY